MFIYYSGFIFLTISKRNFEKNNLGGFDRNKQSIVYISCVESVQTSFNIVEILNELKEISGYYRSKGRYWIDFGDSQQSGQVLFSSIGKIKQPDSEKFETVESLRFIRDEFGDLLKVSESQDDTPSCSLAEALEKQDLYTNSKIAQMVTSVLWSLFRNGFIESKGFFLNLKTFNPNRSKSPDKNCAAKMQFLPMVEIALLPKLSKHISKIIALSIPSYF